MFLLAKINTLLNIAKVTLNILIKSLIVSRQITIFLNTGLVWQTVTMGAHRNLILGVREKIASRERSEQKPDNSIIQT